MQAEFALCKVNRKQNKTNITRRFCLLKSEQALTARNSLVRDLIPDPGLVVWGCITRSRIHCLFLWMSGASRLQVTQGRRLSDTGKIKKEKKKGDSYTEWAFSVVNVLCVFQHGCRPWKSENKAVATVFFSFSAEKRHQKEKKNVQIVY